MPAHAGARPDAGGSNAPIYGGWTTVLSGLKTWLETGELLTTPGSLMYTSRELGPRMPDGDPTSPRYVQPGWFTRHVFNPTVALLTRAGVSVWGSRELRVRGRSTGEWRTTPVNLLTLDGEQFLVAPRGHTQWVRNLRIAGTGELRVGRHTDEFDATEIDDAEKVPILRAYLKRWKAEVGVFFGGVSADSSDDELRRIAPDHPVFRVHLTPR